MAYVQCVNRISTRSFATTAHRGIPWNVRATVGPEKSTLHRARNRSISEVPRLHRLTFLLFRNRDRKLHCNIRRGGSKRKYGVTSKEGGR